MGLKDWFGGKKGADKKASQAEGTLEQVAQLRRMGRLEDARQLLETQVRAEPDHLELLKTHWDICVQLERPEAAVRSMMRRIQLELRSGDSASAIFHWFEAAERLEETPRPDPDTQGRLAEAMLAGDQAEEAAAFLEDADQDLPPSVPAGALIRLAKAAAQSRSPSAPNLVAAALQRPGLPESMQADLQGALQQAQADGLRRRSDAVDDAPIELASGGPAVRKLRLIPAVPLAVDGDQIVLDITGQGRRRMALNQIQGVAAVRIDDGLTDAWILIDLMLDSLWSDKELIRTVRLRTRDFDPCALVPEAEDFQLALGTLLSNLLAVSQAYPLPDAEAAVGRPFHGFSSIREYEVRVLEVTP